MILVDVSRLSLFPSQVDEIEGNASWHHTQAGHGHSQSAKRYEFDLGLLARERADGVENRAVVGPSGGDSQSLCVIVAAAARAPLDSLEHGF